MGPDAITVVLWMLSFKPAFSLSPFISSVQSLSPVRLFATPWTTACQASLSITSSWSPPKPKSIKSVMPSNHLILCCPILHLPWIFPSIRVFSNESDLHIRWSSIGVSASTSVPPMNTQGKSPLGWIGWISCSLRDSQESSPTPQFKSINSALSFLYSPTLTSIHDYWKNMVCLTINMVCFLAPPDTFYLFLLCSLPRACDFF